MQITYGSVCSGIEAATVAWHVLNWKAAWLAEIEPSPCITLHHHYQSGRPLHMPDPDELNPDLSDDDRKARRDAIRAVAWLPQVAKGPQNLGDFTRIAVMVRMGLVAAPDVLVGGTPCQAYSLAGLRKSLDDARGQLTLAFVELANEIDTARFVRGEPAAIIVWENVPGVLSTKDNAFGCFLAGLAGEDVPLEPTGGKWSNAGCVYGPQRTIAWRIIDAQYTGVAQRRRRVLLVASARVDFDPTAILFEFDGVRRDTAPSREAGQEVAGTISARTSGGGGLGTDFELGGGLQAVDGSVTVMAHGQGGAEISEDRSPTLTCNHEAPIAMYQVQGVTGTLDTRCGEATQNTAVGGCLIAFDSRQDCVSSTELFGALGCSSPQAQAVFVTGDITHTLKAEDFDASEDGTGRGQPIIGVEISHALTAARGNACALDPSRETYPIHEMKVRRLMPIECERLQAFPDNYTLAPIRKVSATRAAAIEAKGDPVMVIDGQHWQMTADGPRYKALGNSMCVNKMRWLGARIHFALTGEQHGWK